MHDALHVIEALRVQFVSHLDEIVACSVDLEGEACGRELDEPQREVAGIGIVIVCLDVADTSIIFLELTLNDTLTAATPFDATTYLGTFTVSATAS